MRVSPFSFACGLCVCANCFPRALRGCAHSRRHTQAVQANALDDQVKLFGAEVGNVRFHPTL